MTIPEFYEGLKNIGYPVAYHSFPEGHAPDPPYLIYHLEGTDNLFADGQVYKEISEIRLELYSDKKDLEAEKKIGEWLNENGFPWQKDEVYIESEKLLEVIFSTAIC